MKLNLFAPLNLTSYGYCSAYFFRGLLSQGVDIKYFPIGPVSHDQSIRIDQENLNANALVHPNTPCLKIWHQHSLAEMIGNGIKIAYTIFELDTFTEREISHLASVDHIIVPSNWARQIVLNHLPDAKVSVVPLGYDPSVFKPSDTSSFSRGGNYVFANFGKWEVRKGHDVLKKAFNEAFSEKDDVELWMMPHNFFLTPEKEQVWHNYYLNSKLGSKIRIMPRVPEQSSVAQIMSMIDCAVFPSRAEGWNLEALECLACGKPVIATNYSAHTEFLSPSNSFLIDLPEREVAYDDIFFHGQGNWGKWTKDSFDQLVEEMRFMYNNKISTNSQDPSEYTWANSSRKLLEVIS